MKVRNIVGAALIVLSIAGIIVWEGFGRDRLTRTPVLCAASEIEAGAVISPEMLEIRNVLNDDIIDGAAKEADISYFTGKKAAFGMKKGQQLAAGYAVSEDNTPRGSFFQLLPSWIFSRSSAMRAGDVISVYVMPERQYLGSYKAAFVKGGDETEITDGGVISHVEIECKRSDYFKIYDAVMEKGEGCLLLVIDREEKIK